jgi:hypothetical protein
MINEGDDMRRGLAEVLEMAAKEKKNADKITVLTMNDSPQLRKMIKYILDPQVVWWDFLKGTPAPYKPNKYMDAEGRLFQDLRILYMFCESGDDWMGLKDQQYLTRMGLQNNLKKRQRIWIQLLESVTPEDALLLLSAPNREFPFKGLSRKIIDETFPGLLSPESDHPNTITTIVPIEEPVAPPHGIAPQRPATEIVELTIEDILGEKFG